MDRELALLNRAANQNGLFTRADAKKLVTARVFERRLNKKRFRELLPGVYFVAGAPPTREQEMYAVLLWLKRGFAFSHATAAGLHRLRGYGNSGELVISVGRRTRNQPTLTIHRSQFLSKRDVVKQGELPITSVERTLFDVAPTESNLKALLDDSLSRKKTTLDRLELELRRFDHWGRSPLWKLIDAYRGGDAPTESELERIVIKLLIKAGLPLPTKQAPLYIAGKLRRLDFLWENLGIVLEADGYLTHSSTDAFESDRERHNALTEGNLVSLHWTWTALHTRADALLAQLRAVMISRGAVLP